jgi:hypothetical protein
MSDADLVSIEAEISQHLKDRPIVKHCVEVVPFRITEGLAQACVMAGYHHIVLIRLDQTARMMSWLFMAAGAASRDELDALSRHDVETRLSKLTKAHFVLGARHSRASVNRLKRLKGLLGSCGTGHLVLAYEDIFLRSRKGIENSAFRDGMRFLGFEGFVAVAPEKAAAVDRWLIDARQRSHRYYPLMTGHFSEPPIFAAELDFRIGEYAGSR